MRQTTRQLFDTYVSRRSPWGPPWWVYGATFGVTNLIRQVAIILSPAEIPTPARIASWVATVLLTIGLVNAIALIHRRLTRHPGQSLPDTPVCPSPL